MLSLPPHLPHKFDIFRRIHIATLPDMDIVFLTICLHFTMKKHCIRLSIPKGLLYEFSYMDAILGSVTNLSQKRVEAKCKGITLLAGYSTQKNSRICRTFCSNTAISRDINIIQQQHHQVPVQS